MDAVLSPLVVTVNSPVPSKHVLLILLLDLLRPNLTP
jgi:hypothetical protein